MVCKSVTFKFCDDSWDKLSFFPQLDSNKNLYCVVVWTTKFEKFPSHCKWLVEIEYNHYPPMDGAVLVNKSVTFKFSLWCLYNYPLFLILMVWKDSRTLSNYIWNIFQHIVNYKYRAYIMIIYQWWRKL